MKKLDKYRFPEMHSGNIVERVLAFMFGKLRGFTPYGDFDIIMKYWRGRYYMELIPKGKRWPKL